MTVCGPMHGVRQACRRDITKGKLRMLLCLKECALAEGDPETDNATARCRRL